MPQEGGGAAPSAGPLPQIATFEDFKKGSKNGDKGAAAGAGAGGGGSGRRAHKHARERPADKPKDARAAAGELARRGEPCGVAGRAAPLEPPPRPSALVPAGGDASAAALREAVSELTKKLLKVGRQGEAGKACRPVKARDGPVAHLLRPCLALRPYPQRHHAAGRLTPSAYRLILDKVPRKVGRREGCALRRIRLGLSNRASALVAIDAVQVALEQAPLLVQPGAARHDVHEQLPRQEQRANAVHASQVGVAQRGQLSQHCRLACAHATWRPDPAL